MSQSYESPDKILSDIKLQLSRE